jgi:Ca2+-binding RTX toxin-like protein
MASGPAAVSGTDILAARPALDTASTWNVATTPTAPPPPAPPPPPPPVTPPSEPDSLLGTSAADRLTGTDGADLIDALAGSDTLNGMGGNDTLKGGASGDLLDGGLGADLMFGGTGDDVFYVDNSGDIVTEYSWEGRDTVRSSVSYTLSQYVENLELIGSAGVAATGNGDYNSLTGNGGANLLSGLGGNDRLYGGDGNDRLEGGTGNDLLQGDAGTDTHLGGAGADIFDWNDAAHAGKGAARDVVLDFVQGSDKIDLSGIDAAADVAGNQAFSFIGANAFSGVDGQLRFQEYDASSGNYTLVQGDLNGDRVADFEIQLNGELPDLRATDFVL